jgi:hypothetical protein
MQFQAVLHDGYIYNIVFVMKPQLYINSWLPTPKKKSGCMLALKRWYQYTVMCSTTVVFNWTIFQNKIEGYIYFFKFIL